MNPPTDLTLLILAAGLGSRSGGPKQIEGYGPHGETIADFSIYDAVQCGFNKVVLIVRQEMLEVVQGVFQPRWQGRLRMEFVIQSLDRAVPPCYSVAERTRPWGTGHALLCAKDAIHEPFAVINADDFYGREAFAALARHFRTAGQSDHAMLGYKLKYVLSDHGSVSRGCGEVDGAGYLKSLTERRTIVRERDGDNKRIVARDAAGESTLDPDTVTSMNCWGFHASIFQEAEQAFDQFLAERHASGDAEFYIPAIVDHMVQGGRGRVKVLTEGCTWFGVTYPEDKPVVAQKLKAMVDQGRYSPRLT